MKGENRKVSSKRATLISASIGALVGAILGWVGYSNNWLG